MTAVLELDTARAEYARWFVQRALVDKKRPFAGPSDEWVRNWRRAEGRGYIRYAKVQYPAIGSVSGWETIRDEFDPSLYSSLLGVAKAEERWWRVSMEDLDDPINDDNPMVLRYRGYREAAKNMALWEWLKAEAEHHLLTNGAWLRAYGVEVPQ